MIFSSRSLRLGMFLWVLLAVLLASIPDAVSVSAATILVTTTVDENGTGPDCSLREAIHAANTDSAYGGCSSGVAGADIISLPPGIYTYGSQSIIFSEISIQAENPLTTIIQANACNPVESACSPTSLIFYIGPSGMLNLSNLTVRHGNETTSNNGGVIFNFGSLSILGSIITANYGNDGGAIQNFGTLTIEESTISENMANYSGGAIYNEDRMTVRNSTFSGNEAGTHGGAIMNNVDTLDITNSTFSGNTAALQGGAIFNAGTLTLLNNTLSDNESGIGGDGIYNGVGFTLNFTNTIIANAGLYLDCDNQGTMGTNLKNFVQDNSCSPAFQGNPLLGPLADNGGFTQTHALLPGSPAIDQADPTACPETDQRGVTRPQRLGCDIGAFELENHKSFLPLLLK